MSQADDMGEAARKLGRELINQFNYHGSQSIDDYLVSGTSVRRDDVGNLILSVDLARDPTPPEAAQLPKTYDNFLLTYRVSGKARFA
jgi:hypothetical protein